MSSTEQAFVKAFARRHRTQVNPAIESADVAATGAVTSPTKTWIDSAEDRQMRIDDAEASVAKPFVAPASPAIIPRHRESNVQRDIQVVAPEKIASMVAIEQSREPIATPSLPATEKPARPADAAGTTADELARLIASLSHVDTAIAHVDAPVVAGWTEIADVPPSLDQQLFTDRPHVTAPAPKHASETAAVETPLAKDTAGDTKSVVDEAVLPVSVIPRRKPAAFQAAWEISVLDVPKMVADLFFRETLFQELSDRMADAVAGGMKTVMVTSAQHGEGRTSTAMGIALSAGAAGLRVALVDADFEQPTLADDFRLDLEYGWLDTIRAGLSVREVAVLAVEDAVTFIPLVDHARTKPATADEVAMLVETLEDNFDLIVIDAPKGTSHHLQSIASRVDSAIIVRDAARTQAADVEDFARWLTNAGVQGVGMVENFVA